MSNKIDQKTELAILNKTIESLEERRKSLKKVVDAEIERLERLRNEVTHLTEQKQSLNTAEHDFETYKDKTIGQLEDRRLDLDIKQSANEKESQRLLAVKNQLCQDRAAVESREISASSKHSILDKKEAELEKKELGIKALNESLIANIALNNQKIVDVNLLIADSVKWNKENELKLKEIHSKTKALEILQAKYDQTVSEKEASLNKILSSNQVILEAVESKARDSQLSIDRQYNDLELYKKTLQTANLRLLKFAKENNIESQFEALRKEFGL